MKLTALCVLALQIILFFVGTIVVLWGFAEVAKEGGGIVPGFGAIQLSRFIAFLAPYLALPISSLLTFIFYRKAKYGTSVWLPLTLIAIIFTTGQLYLKIVPDPIMENFGAHASPDPGFLVLPADAVPPDFKETKHHYTKSEYMINFTQLVSGKKVDLNIIESDVCQFETVGEEPVQKFTYLGITGEVYMYHHRRTQETSFNLLWLNPPKQRLAIYLSQSPVQEYSPEDLISILKSMRLSK